MNMCVKQWVRVETFARMNHLTSEIQKLHDMNMRCLCVSNTIFLFVWLFFFKQTAGQKWLACKCSSNSSSWKIQWFLINEIFSTVLLYCYRQLLTGWEFGEETDLGPLSSSLRYSGFSIMISKIHTVLDLAVKRGHYRYHRAFTVYWMKVCARVSISFRPEMLEAFGSFWLLAAVPFSSALNHFFEVASRLLDSPIGFYSPAGARYHQRKEA